MNESTVAVREREPDSDELLVDSSKKDEAKHRHIMDICITISGFVIIVLFGFGEWIIVIKDDASNTELVKNFFSLVNSAVMLILGYLFGARKQYT